MECVLVYEDLEGLLTFQTMHLYVYTDLLSKIVSRALISCSQQEDPSGHTVNLCR
jgi:hypothetical protein